MCCSSGLGHCQRGQKDPRDSCAVQSVVGRGLGLLPCLCDRNGDPEVACLEHAAACLLDVLPEMLCIIRGVERARLTAI